MIVRPRMSTTTMRKIGRSGERRIATGSCSTLPRKRIAERRRGGEVEESFDQDVRSAMQVGDGDLLVGVVARIRLAGEPHAEGDGARQPLGVGASSGDRGRGVLAGRAAIRG